MLVITKTTLLLLNLMGCCKVDCCRIHIHTHKHTHKREPAPTIEAYQNTVCVISLRLSLNALAP
jgi:hypothetical protein